MEECVKDIIKISSKLVITERRICSIVFSYGRRYMGCCFKRRGWKQKIYKINALM